MCCHPLPCAYMVDGHEMVTTEREAIEQGVKHALDFYDVKSLVHLVLDLANTPAPYDDEYGDCFLCPKVSLKAPVNVEDHDPSCPWRRAREWVDTHEVV